jgi:hypothetical protein
MIRIEVASWAAWAPGLEDEASWRHWCANPKELEREGKPDVSFLPAILRRRCGPLARIMLNAAFRCCDAEQRMHAASVFASRHGNINESIEMLEHLARHQSLSPTRFSHSVHNAQAGLFSIAAGNREPSSSLAAQEDTFGAAWLEAMILLARAPERPCLLVIGEVPLAPAFAELVDEPESAYALALLLRARDEPAALGLRFEAGAGVRQPPRWPDALDFLRFLLSDETRFEVEGDLHRTVWERAAR